MNDKNRLKFTRRISEVKDILTFQVNNRSEHSLQTKYNNFFDQLSIIYDECFPLVTRKIHSKTLSKPWITPEIQNLIKKKNKQFSIKHNIKTASSKKKYKEIKQTVTKTIANEKQKYYKSLLDKTNNNIKQKWNAI